MRTEVEILRLLGYPENPLEALRRITSVYSRSPKAERRKLVSIQFLVQDPEFRVHPAAWKQFLSQCCLPPTIFPNEVCAPSGWPIPVFLERAGCGGVVHVMYETGGQETKGHRLDFAAAMEVFLETCSNIGETAFPNSSCFPFAARVRPGISVDGRSWELSCLVGYFAVHSQKEVAPVFTTGAVSSDGSLVPVERVAEKIKGWLREVGPGGVALVLEEQQEEIVPLMGHFDQVHVIRDLSDLVEYFRMCGWFQIHQRPPNRLRLERMLRESEAWYRHGRPKLALRTLEAVHRHKKKLTPRQNVLFLDGMHYLNSCFGRFDKGLVFLKKMKVLLEQEANLLSPDEKAIRMAKAAVQLYDAHLFGDAEELLRPLLEKSTFSGLSEVSRAKVLGTLGQVLTASGSYEEAASLLAEAVGIFKAIEPLEVSRAYNYLIHNRLRAGDLVKAGDLLVESEEWIEETDTYGKLFRAFYRAELDRRYKRPTPRPKLPEGYAGLIHPYAFSLQAWARNHVHPHQDREHAIEEAAQRLEQVLAKGGVLEFLAHTYRVYKAVLLGDEDSFREARENWATWLDRHGKSPFKHRYQRLPCELTQARRYVDELLDRIPYH